MLPSNRKTVYFGVSSDILKICTLSKSDNGEERRGEGGTNIS